MNETRLLRLLTILQSRRFWSGNELAERLEITPRTLRRDIERLRSLGYGVDATSGPGGGYAMSEGTDMPPLVVNEDEAVALSVALQAALHDFTDMNESALSLLVKLEQLLPQVLKKKARDLSKSTVSLGQSKNAVSAHVLVALANACRERRIASFDYTKRGGESSTREVEPLHLVHSTYRVWYLIAYDRQREDFRTFRINRITSAVNLLGVFTPKSLPMDVSAYMEQSLSSTHYKERAKIRIHGPFEQVQAEIPSWLGRLSKESECTCLLYIGGDEFRSIAAQLMFLDHDLQILEPVTLKDYMRTVMTRLQ